jgi:uncharacterized membrane protein
MHVLFALFDRPTDATAAVHELERLGTERRHCTIVLHERGLESQPAEELDLFETAAASTTARAAVIGSVVGGALGTLLVGPFGLVGAGTLAAVLFGAAVGTAGGALAGALAGPSEADPIMVELSRELEKGKVLLAIEPPSLDCMEIAEGVLHKHHARVVHRHLFRPITEEERSEIEASRPPGS